MTKKKERQLRAQAGRLRQIANSTEDRNKQYELNRKADDAETEANEIAKRFKYVPGIGWLREDFR